MAASIETLYGLDAESASKLKEQGLSTIEEFYEMAKHGDTRAELAEKTGLDPFKLEEWSSVAGNFILMQNCEW